MESSPILAGLNDAQRKAVTIGDGPVLVLAGPGSGKTSVLTRRIAHLISERNIAPRRMMAMTFTNKAAREMRQRVEGLLGDDLKGAQIGTFHANCARILRIEADHLPINRDYVIYDTADQTELVKQIVTDVLVLDPKRYKPASILNRISQAKNDLITPERFQPQSYLEEIAQRAYEYYQQSLFANNAVDFDDLLLQVVLLFENNPVLLAKYQHSYDYILVDEFQDTNYAQYQLMKHLAGGTGNVFAVGDEDQSIYRWRGADYRNIMRLREDYSGLRTILLEQNYRSTQRILDAARAVIDRNPNRVIKKLFTEKGTGQVIELYEAHNEQFEAQFVVDTIANLTLASNINPGDCAVIYRTNAQSRALEEAFIRASLPYRLVGATRFYNRREIKDLVAYLRVIHNPDDGISLARIINVPARGIGQKTLETLSAWARQRQGSLYSAMSGIIHDPSLSPLTGKAGKVVYDFGMLLNQWITAKQHMNTHELLKMVIEEIGYGDYLADGTEQGVERWENVQELVKLTSEYDELSLATFLEEVSLVSEVDDLPVETSAPTLMTLHAAKGLEFDVVFLVGLEEGILPHSRSKDEGDEGIEEERRLFYVGMTRARRILFLTYAFRRTSWGENALAIPSRFLEDIPRDLLSRPLSGGWKSSRPERNWAWAGGTTSSPSMRSVSAPLRVDDGPARSGTDETRFKPGQHVFHDRFGKGVVLSSKHVGEDEEVSVIFELAGPKKLMASFARLDLMSE